MYGYIYKGTNLINNKIYIGQHKSDGFDPKYYGSGKLWKRAYNKYGLNNIKIELIEECNSREELNTREAFWIKTYNSQDKLIGYNILGNDMSPHAANGKNNGMYGKKHSEETRKKLSEAAKHRPPRTLEERKKQGRPGIPKSEEHRKKISNALKGKRPSDKCINSVRKSNSKSFEVFDENYNFIMKFERQKDLLKFLNITYLNKKLKECIILKKLYEGYYIRYA